MDSFLLQASIYLLAAILAVPVAKRLGLGSVLGYLMAGIVIGPLTGLVGSETRDLQHFAEFGVVMMLFLVGLELEPRALWDMRHRLIGLGGLQIGLTAAAITAGAIFFGVGWEMALAIGLTFSLSSTAIVLQTLNEKGLMATPGGRNAFSVLLSQDIAVIPMLALIPLLAVHGLNSTSAAEGAGHGAEGAAGAVSLVEGLPGWGVTLVTIAVIGAVVLGGIYLTRPLFRFIHSAHLRELYTAVSLLIVVGIASLMILVGLSPALGTFLAGVVLANSEFRHELEADIEPFKGLLLGLFFITVGAGINFIRLYDDLTLVVSITLAVMLVKAVVLWCLAVAFRLRGRDKWLFTLGLAQAGEFGFVMLSFTVQQDVISTEISEILLLVVAMSMLLTPLLFIVYDQIAKRLDIDGTVATDEEIDAIGKVIIAGVGRFGQNVDRMLQGSGFETTVLDKNMETIEMLRRFGARGFLGDASRPDLLKAAGLDDASVLIIALDDMEASQQIVAHARRDRPDLHIIARARTRTDVFRLYRAGANDVVREVFDSSLRVGRYALEALGLSDYDASRQERAFYRLDRRTNIELVQVWDSDIPIQENQAFIDRAKELNAELIAELATTFDGDEEAPDTALADED